MINKLEKVNGGKVFQKTLKEVSPIVNQYVQEEIRNLRLPSKLEKELLGLPLKRESKDIMRPALTYLAYKSLGGNKTIEEISPLLAMSELNNYSCYLDNWILDNKNGVGNDSEKVNQITISSQILRELTQKVIESAKIPENQKREISKRLAETTIDCYNGQFRDLGMTVETIGEYKSDGDFLDAYLSKSHLQSGALYGLSGEIGAILAENNPNPIYSAMNVLGTGLHVSNDLGDFALFTNEDGSFKPYQDQMADIKNGRMSFPIYYVLKHGNEEEKQALSNLIGNFNPSKEEMFGASKAIITSGAYEETRKKVLNRYWHFYKKLIKQLPSGMERDALSSVGKVITHNKYLAVLKNNPINFK